VDDGLPNQICSNCEERFRDAFALRNLAEKNDNVLRKMLLHATNNKDTTSAAPVEIKMETTDIEVAVKLEDQR
jgi:hypothetical protein